MTRKWIKWMGIAVSLALAVSGCASRVAPTGSPPAATVRGPSREGPSKKPAAGLPSSAAVGKTAWLAFDTTEPVRGEVIEGGSYFDTDLYCNVPQGTKVRLLVPARLGPYEFNVADEPVCRFETDEGLSFTFYGLKPGPEIEEARAKVRGSGIPPDLSVDGGTVIGESSGVLKSRPDAQWSLKILCEGPADKGNAVLQAFAALLTGVPAASQGKKPTLVAFDTETPVRGEVREYPVKCGLLLLCNLPQGITIRLLVGSVLEDGSYIEPGEGIEFEGKRMPAYSFIVGDNLEAGLIGINPTSDIEDALAKYPNVIRLPMEDWRVTIKPGAIGRVSGALKTWEGTPCNLAVLVTTVLEERDEVRQALEALVGK